MKVLWFSNTPASGAEFLQSGKLGGGWLSALDKALSDKCELHIAFKYPKYSVDFNYNGVYYHPVCKKNYKWHFIKNTLLGEFTDQEDLPKYLELINSIHPDIIHINGTENPFGCIVDKVEIPVVVSIQGNITVYFHKFLSGFARKYLSIPEFKFKRIIDFPYYRSFNKNYEEFAKMRDREIRNLKNVKFVIGRTDWDRRITRVLAPQSNYFRSEEMLRESFYHQSRKPEKHDKLVIHTTNGNSPYKGFETLCSSLALLNKLGYDIEWRVAGIKNEDLIVKVVKKLLGKQYPEKGLMLLGALNEEKLVEKLLEADLYVMPSHIENSPNNLCEAMILGLPCIASYAGGTGSILKDGEEGILIQDGDPWVLAGAILELLNNPEKAIDLGMKARERALKRHNRENIVDSLLDIYTTIIKHGKKD
ncbi:MAG: glycosyltransferase family 4 protein [Prolixibacteraceae bacterium]|jgi:glycosyltransferase involved in cell wall biosynthesis|nr:glycosyltransferase family 4 protein [Prolixibacteraceae bacterium]